MAKISSWRAYGVEVVGVVGEAEQRVLERNSTACQIRAQTSHPACNGPHGCGLRPSFNNRQKKLARSYLLPDSGQRFFGQRTYTSESRIVTFYKSAMTPNMMAVAKLELLLLILQGHHLE